MSKPTVLVVDDDQAIQYGAELRLRAAGYDTLTAGDGADGFSLAAEQQPDVILLDVRMPRVDGLTALEMLRNDPRTRHVPVIMLSASLRDRQRALDAGAHFFLTKPYRSSDLLAAIQAVREGRTALEEVTS